MKRGIAGLNQKGMAQRKNLAYIGEASGNTEEYLSHENGV